MIKLTSSVDFTDGILVIPSVCVGNVAQLAADLIVETLKMQKVGILWHPAVIPIIGPPAYWRDKKDSTTTACELFTVDTAEMNKISVLQIRSPLVASLMFDFFQQLTEFVEKQKFREVIILSSCYAHEKHLVEESPFEYNASKGFERIHHDKISPLNWKKHSGEGFPHILGGGFASQLFQRFEERNIPTLLLYKYVSEGDNSPDAHQMTSKLNEYLGVLPKKEDGTVKLTTPPSWRLLFGDAAPRTMF